MNELPYPASPDAEKGVLSSCLQAPELIGKTADRVSSDIFYSGNRDLLWGAMVELSLSANPVDIISLTNLLRNKKNNQGVTHLDMVGGPAELADTLSFAPSAAHWEYYLGIAKEQLIRRRLLLAAADIQKLAQHERDTPIIEIIEQSEHKVLAVTQEAERSEGIGPEHIRNILIRSVDKMQEWMSDTGEGAILRTGFEDLDEILVGGLYPHGYGLLGARPSVGKTTLALNIGANVAEAGAGVAIFSHETASDYLTMRLISKFSRVPYRKIRKGKLNPERDMPKIHRAVERIQKLPIWIEQAPAMNINALKSHVRRLVSEHGIKVVLIDYVQLLEPVTKRGKQNDYAAVTEISRGLKALSLELPVYILGVCQLSREAGEDKAPTMKHLKSTGQLEQDATEILLAHEVEESGSDEIVINLRIAKQKEGAKGDVQLEFERSTFTFKDSDK